MVDEARTSPEKAVILSQGYTGHRFSLVEKNTLRRRIERHMGTHQIDKITACIHLLQENPQELRLRFQEALDRPDELLRANNDLKNLLDARNSPPCSRTTKEVKQ